MIPVLISPELMWLHSEGLAELGGPGWPLAVGVG